MTSPDRIVAPRGSRVRVRLGAAVVLVLVGLAVAVLVAALGTSGSTRTLASKGAETRAPAWQDSDAAGPPDGPAEGGQPDAGQPDAGQPDGGQSGAIILVHLLGAVANPGLYELRDGDRAVDAVAAAGGFTATADRGQLNLARPLADGEQIRVPAIGEVPPAPPGATGTPGSPGAAGGRVDLNTADAATLDTLPGIGPATAKRILDWREQNGRFTAIEDLLSVTGIGEKTFAALEDLVTV